jgi:hypothetical protein
MKMSGYAALHADIERRIAGLLNGLSEFSPTERQEVAEFLDATEYGMALETISGILVEENKPIDVEVLHEIDELSRAMKLRDEGFMYHLHNTFDRQHRAAAT